MYWGSAQYSTAQYSTVQPSTMGWYRPWKGTVLTRVKTGTALNNSMLREGSPRMIWFHVHEASRTDKYSPR